MRGDFSRIRFNQPANYTAVLEQQGRVRLDADANEQALIDAFQSGAQLTDIVGLTGVPAGSPGFGISLTAAASDLMIGAGRLYTSGLVIENDAALAYSAQPFLAAPATAGAVAAQLIQLAEQGSQFDPFVLHVYLIAWQRLVTALDDPALLEPAIGQADTTARLQTVWQVQSQLIRAQAGFPAPVASTGSLTASTAGADAACGCGPVAAAGYQGIENQLYRVEIQDGGDETTATFKWSRENASVVVAVTGVNGATVSVSSLGPDTNLGFAVGDWVELTDDSVTLGLTPNTSGTLYQIASIPPGPSPTVTLTVTGPPVSVDHTLNARMRRWDQSGPLAAPSGIPVTAGTAIDLENGIQVTFGDGRYQPGDYWTIPARTATGDVEWPAGQNLPPTSFDYSYTPLAVVAYLAGQPAGSAASYNVTDLRPSFSSLAALTPAAAPQATHITEVSFVNDDITTLDQVAASGVAFTLDQVITSPMNSGNLIVTMELPTGVGIDLDSGLMQPSTIVRAVGLLDTNNSQVDPTLPRQESGIAGIIVNNNRLIWQLPYNGPGVEQLQQVVVAFLDEVMSAGIAIQWFARLRFRLLGRMIWAGTAASPLYLDGQVFGQPATQANGIVPRLDLRLPSGNNEVASDFEGWFYVAPTLQVTGLAISDAAVTVVLSGSTVTGVKDTGTGTALPGLTATVTLNYPALPVTVAAEQSVTLTSSNPAIVSVPQSVPLSEDVPTLTFPVTVTGNPGVSPTGLPVTDTITITATLGAAVPPSSSAQVTLAVTGVPSPPPFIRTEFPGLGPITEE